MAMDPMTVRNQKSLARPFDSGKCGQPWRLVLLQNVENNFISKSWQSATIEIPEETRCHGFLNTVHCRRSLIDLHFSHRLP